MGMAPLRGGETAPEIIILAYGMEKGLGEFYSLLSSHKEGTALADLFTRLAAFEEDHRQKLFALYETLTSEVPSKEAFESGIVSEMMEGGFTAEEFLEKNRPVLQTAADILSVAMMLEAQALDLYLRYALKAKEEKSKKVLYAIAEDEKAHLSALGNLMEANAHGS